MGLNQKHLSSVFLSPKVMDLNHLRVLRQLVGAEQDGRKRGGGEQGAGGGGRGGGRGAGGMNDKDGGARR